MRKNLAHPHPGACGESPICSSGKEHTPSADVDVDVDAPRRILAALSAKYGGAYAWAAARGHRARTVYLVIQRWGPRRDREPLGGMGRQIMADLRADLGTEVVPEVASAADAEPRDAA